MPDRHLREPQRALLQRLERMEANVASLGQRAWRGAMRTAHLGATADETAFTIPSALTLEAPPGRWEVHVSAVATGPTTGFEEWALFTRCRSIDTFEETDPHGVLPSASLSTTSATNADSPMRRTLTAFGWVQPEERFVFSLGLTARVWGTGLGHSTPPKWTDLRIMMLPW